MPDNVDTPGLHPLLATRWSPTSFDPSHEVATTEADLLLEAARWAPSAGDSQAGAFIVGPRGARASHPPPVVFHRRPLRPPHTPPRGDPLGPNRGPGGPHGEPTGGQP